MSALLNLGSLLLGLIAWIVPILSMKRSVKYVERQPFFRQNYSEQEYTF